jgi:L-alanine-DL-glutamate epimerase-like enolase superfamily enzyme
MRIVAADIYDVNLHEWKPPIILRLITDEGLYGLGEFPLAYGTGRQAAIGILKDMVEGFVLGADPMLVEKMWHTLFRRTFWGQGGGTIIYGGMSTIDEALWDIKGKALGRPIYDLLGGKVRDSIRCYANGWYSAEWAPGNNWRPITPEEFGSLSKEVVAMGYDALKFNPFGAPPGVDWPENERILDPRRADLGFERVAAVRDAVGPDVDIMVEVHGWLGPTSAIEMGRRLVELKPYFYEEPVDAMNVECMRKVGQNVPIPLAAGERSLHPLPVPRVHRRPGGGYPPADVGLAGGITELKRSPPTPRPTTCTCSPTTATGRSPRRRRSRWTPVSAIL